MSDDEIEGEANEGEEEEEGGEDEEEKEEEEEVKEEPKPVPRYIPRTNPLTQVLNVNRDLDMLNSEVNLLSSQFTLMSSSMAGNPTYYNMSPTRNYSSTYQISSPMKYSSPIRNAQSSSYWNNPNHITLSPGAGTQPKVYGVPDSYNYSTQYRSSNYNAPYMGGMNNTYNTSPIKYQSPSYKPPYSAMNMQASSMNNQGIYNYQNQNFGDNSLGQLLGNIDNVLSNNAPRPQSPVMHNTFDRDQANFRPNFQMHTQYEPRQTSTERSKPPLYQPARNYSQRRDEQMTSMNDFYNRQPAISRQNINNVYRPVTPFQKTTSPLRSSQRKSPHFQRASMSARRPASEFEIKDAVKTLFR